MPGQRLAQYCLGGKPRRSRTSHVARQRKQSGLPHHDGLGFIPALQPNILNCAEVALWLKEYFDELKLETFIKTSGSKGLQLYVPLNTSVSYDVTKPFARNVAEQMERQHPDRVVSKMEKRLRVGKVLVDWSQNDRHKTTVCVYSLRAKEQPTVSTPVTWDEVRNALKKKQSRTA